MTMCAMPCRVRPRSLRAILAIGGAAACAAAVMLLTEAEARAAEVDLAWDANTDPTIVGYKLYYATHAGAPYDGTGANEGPSPIDIP